MTEGAGHEAISENGCGVGCVVAVPDRGSDGTTQEFGACVQEGGDRRAALKDECLKQEISHSLEAQTAMNMWQNTYTASGHYRPRGYWPPRFATFPDLAFRLPMAAVLQ